MKYRTIFKALKIQEEIVILQEIKELQDSVPRLHRVPMGTSNLSKLQFPTLKSSNTRQKLQSFLVKVHPLHLTPRLMQSINQRICFTFNRAI